MMPPKKNLSRLDIAESRIDALQNHLVSIDRRIDRLDGRFEGVDGRFEHIENLLEAHNKNHHGLKTRVKSGISIGVVLAALTAICELVNRFLVGGV